MTDFAHDPNCVFCKIVHGQIPSSTILETGEILVFLDIHPVNPGHVLIVPKGHHPQLDDLSEPVAALAGSLLPRLCRAIRAATGAEGLNVVINNGRAAGQTVEHCHWHIIPRFHGDPVDWPWPQGEYVGNELIEMKSRIERELGFPTHPDPSGDSAQSL